MTLVLLRRTTAASVNPAVISARRVTRSNSSTDTGTAAVD
jgi:hypothetical protein